MSRIGKKQITIPEKTTVAMVGQTLTVKGPLGELTRDFGSQIAIEIKDNVVTLTPARAGLEALWGTYASHIGNMIAGVNTLFQKKLIVEGIGYKSEVKGKELILNLGFSHQVKIAIPDTLKVTAEKNVITVSGLDIETVGQFVAKVRSQKKPEPYKGKGIRYDGEVIKRKQGKKSV
jgi:large subunit ribosomal protein L6